MAYIGINNIKMVCMILVIWTCRFSLKYRASVINCGQIPSNRNSQPIARSSRLNTDYDELRDAMVEMLRVWFATNCERLRYVQLLMNLIDINGMP